MKGFVKVFFGILIMLSCSKEDDPKVSPDPDFYLELQDNGDTNVLRLDTAISPIFQGIYLWGRMTSLENNIYRDVQVHCMFRL